MKHEFRTPQSSVRARRWFVALAASIVASISSGVRAATPTFQGLGAGGGAFPSYAFAVSDDGTTVVGSASSIGAFRWTAASGMVGLGSPLSLARDVSADGAVVIGEVRATSNASRQPFRWTAPAGIVVLRDPLGVIVRGQAFAVSSDGDVVTGVGASSTANQAFRWTPETGIVGIGWVPNNFQDSFGFGISGDGSVIVGLSGAPNTEPFRWTQTTGMVGLGDVPGGHFYAIAEGISGDGSMLVGKARVASSVDEAFFWRADVGFVRPDSLHEATLGSGARGANFDGSVVVGFTTAEGAMIWDAGHGMRSLQTVLTADFGLDLTGWTLWTAQDISADGTAIVGTGRNPNGDTEAWIARVPALSTSTLLPEREPRIRVALRGANPFRNEITFALAVPADGFAAPIHAAVYGVDGKLVRTLLHAPMTSGTHLLPWDGTNTTRSRVAAGSYVFRATRRSDAVTRRVVLLH